MRARLALAALALLGAVLAAAAQPARAAEVEGRYRDAAARFHTLRSSGSASAEQWRAVADAFRSIHAEVPTARRGADALFSAALACREAWRVGVEWQDLSRAVADFRAFVSSYRDDRLADDALMHLAALLADGYGDLAAARDTYQRLLNDYPDGDQQPAAQRRLAAVAAVLNATATRDRAERMERAEHNDRAERSGQTAHSAAPAASAPVTRVAAAQAAGKDSAAAGAGAPGSAGSNGSAASNGSAGSARAQLAGIDYGLAAARPADGNDEPAPPGGHVKRVQVWSAPEWTRVILTTDPGVRFTVSRLEADEHRPERVFFDLRAEPGTELAPVTAVGDGVLRGIRISRYDARTTRVVLDLGRMEGYAVKDFRLPGERKIVVDLRPTAAVLAARRKTAAPALAAATLATSPARTPTPAVASASAPQPTPAASAPLPEPLVNAPAGLQVHSIMIDPGHGGHDPGALAYGMEEKTLVLEISRRLRDLLRERHPELRVGLTRERDVFIPLQERPQIAKRFGADLFVSVHLNANPIRRFHGVETYFLNVTQDREALEVAARENAGSGQHLADLNGILLDLLRDSNLIESGELAKTVQASLVTTLRADTGPVRDLGVKQAPFLVLMGAEMPSVLVEAGFITNRDENRRLQDSDYLDQIAQGIYDGLRRYIEQQNIISAARPPASVAANERR